MPILKVEVDKNLSEREFFIDIKERLEKPDLVNNPFNGGVYMLPRDDKLLVFLDLEPIYPDIIPKIGLFLAGLSLLFGWTVLMVAGLLLGLTAFLWSERFFYYVLLRGRKKKGFVGGIRFVYDKEAWRGVFGSWGK